MWDWYQSSRQNQIIKSNYVYKQPKSQLVETLVRTVNPSHWTLSVLSLLSKFHLLMFFKCISFWDVINTQQQWNQQKYSRTWCSDAFERKFSSFDTNGNQKHPESWEQSILSLYLSTVSIHPSLWVFGAQFSSPVLLFGPSVLPSSPLVFAVGRSRLKLSKRQVEQVQHSNPPSLSRTFPTRTPLRDRDTQRHTQRRRGSKTETQWEATGGEERKMLTFGVFQNDTSHLTKHLQSILCSPSTQYWDRRLHSFTVIFIID